MPMHIRVTPLRTSKVESGLQDYRFRLEVNDSSDDSRYMAIVKLVYDPLYRKLYLFDISAEGQTMVELSLSQPKYPIGAAAVNVGSTTGEEQGDLLCVAPMPGVIEQVLVTAGDVVVTGQALVTLIAMKMEHTVRAKADCRVESVVVTPGATVTNGQVLMQLMKHEE